MSKLKNEPAVITSVLVALVGAAATLGIIGTDQQDQLVALITAAVPIIGGLIVRANVTPNAKVPTTAPEPAPADAASVSSEVPADEVPTPEPAPPVEEAAPAPEAPTPDPAPAAPVEDPVKAAMKAAIETVRVNGNNANDARAAAAKAAVDQVA